MDPVERFEKDGTTYAIVIRSGVETEDGVRFITGDLDPLQVGFFERPAGYEVAPHRHVPRMINVERTTEFVRIEEGGADITIYDDQWGVLGNATLGTGDSVLFLRGGHTFRMREPTRLLEVKQGPYPGTAQDKEFLPRS